MANLMSRRLWQLLRIRPAVSNVKSASERNVVTAHAVPLLNSGYDLERLDVLFGSKKWRWMRPATPMESDLDDWIRHHSRFSFPFITINADQEITEDMWRQMLKNLRNQIPNLRMLILPRNNEKWICHADDMDISLKMYENVPPMDVIDELLDEGLDNAPWVCTVIKANPDDACLFPEDKQTKPYQYYWFLSNHHAIFDGTTIALLIRLAIDNLNAVIAGKPIDDRIQLCQARTGDEIIAKKIKIKEAMENNPKWLQKEQERLLSTFKTPLLNEAFPAPKVSNPKTSTIIRTTDPVTLNAFHAQCKTAGVSITNALIAVVNTAIVEMVREAGILRDSYQLTLNTNVDLRRYMNINPMTASGMLVGSMHQSMHPTKNVRGEFWEHANYIHQDAKTLLKTDGTLVEAVVREMSIPRVDPDEVFNSSNTPIFQRDYTFSNMMDVTRVFYNPKRQKHAVITRPVVIQGIQNFNPMMFSMCGYRGITVFILAYATNCLSQDTAEELMDRILLLIRDKAQI